MLHLFPPTCSSCVGSLHPPCRGHLPCMVSHAARSGNPILFSQPLCLPAQAFHSCVFVTLAFTALSFGNPASNSFRHRLHQCLRPLGHVSPYQDGLRPPFFASGPSCLQFSVPDCLFGGRDARWPGLQCGWGEIGVKSWAPPVRPFKQ